MKKITLAIAAFATLYSSVAFSATPAVREITSFNYVLKKAEVKAGLPTKSSEFVIYHQNGKKPCKPKAGDARKAEYAHNKKAAVKKHKSKTAKPVAKIKSTVEYKSK
jgi:hypothetical protein